MFCLSIAMFAFALGVGVQKLGLPHQVKQIVVQFFSVHQNNVEEDLQIISPESEITPTSTLDQDLLRQSLVVVPSRVSLNNEVVIDKASSSNYRFLSAGHIYGAPHDDATHPATSFLQFIPHIKILEPDLLFLVGDIVPSSTTVYFEDFESKVLSSVNIPTFNVVGNHDVENRDLYEQRYGSTFYTFQYGPAQFIVLDSELAACKIEETQKAFLEAAMAQALEDSEISSIFIFMHKALFLDRETLQILFDSGNSKIAPNAQECYLEHNFEDILNNGLLPASLQKPIYLIAGDVGAWGGNLSPLYYKIPDSNLTVMAAGIGDTDDDVALFVEYNEWGTKIHFLYMDGQPFENVQEYGLDFYLGQAQLD